MFLGEAWQGKTPYVSEEEENGEELWLLHEPSSPGLDGAEGSSEANAGVQCHQQGWGRPSRSLSSPHPLSPPPGVTYSDTVSATEPCKPCTQCVGLHSMSAPCVESDDAVCRCAYGYFQDELSGSCKECSICEVGFGLMFPCRDSQDTVCEECPEGTFSDEANFVDPCLPCTICEENEVMVKECKATSDAECRGNAVFSITEGRAGLFVSHGPSTSSCNALCHCFPFAMGRWVQIPRGGREERTPCPAEVPLGISLCSFLMSSAKRFSSSDAAFAAARAFIKREFDSSWLSHGN